MKSLAEELLSRLQASLPESRIVWETPPPADGLRGAVLSAQCHGKTLTFHFEQAPVADGESGGDGDIGVDLEGIVDDFVDFFEHSIYRKEKFTKLVVS